MPGITNTNLTMDNMLGKIVRLLVTVREDYLATLVDLIEKLTGSDGVNWMKNLRLFLRKEQIDWEKVSPVKKVVTTFLKIVKSGISMPSFSAVKTADCFKKGFAYRDSDIDDWMTKDTTVSNAGLVTCYEFTEDGRTFLDMARSILETEETHEKEIARLLVARDKSFTLKQVEDLHKRFIAGETEIGFNTNGYANLFFVHDEKSVFVLRVSLFSDGWFVHVFKLGSSSRWYREYRLFSRN